MKIIIETLLFCSIFTFNLFTVSSLQAQTQFKKIEKVVLQKGHLTQQEWNQFIEYCKVVSDRSGIPVEVLVGIAIRESGYFSSDLAKTAFNIFGVTALRDWSKGKVYRMGHPIKNERTGKFENKSTPFRFYESRIHSIYDFATFISHPRYAKAWTCGDDIACWLDNLQAAGYAQDDIWAIQILEMLKRYDVLDTRISRPSLGK